MENLIKKCDHCGKSLKKYKIWREWSERNLHYVCYKKKQEAHSNAVMLELYNEEKKVI